jgi:hypothetical protein
MKFLGHGVAEFLVWLILTFTKNRISVFITPIIIQHLQFSDKL